jgi:hypothetical protein
VNFSEIEPLKERVVNLEKVTAANKIEITSLKEGLKKANDAIA